MMAASDLFDYADVVDHADAIVGSLRSGQMPCYGAWPAPRWGSSSSGLTRASPPSRETRGRDPVPADRERRRAQRDL